MTVGQQAFVGRVRGEHGLMRPSRPRLALGLEDYEQRLRTIETNQASGRASEKLNEHDVESVQDTPMDDAETEIVNLSDFHESYRGRFFPVWDRLSRLPNLKEMYISKTYMDPGRDETRIHVEGLSRMFTAGPLDHLDVLCLDLDGDYSWGGELHEAFLNLHSLKDLRLNNVVIKGQDWAGFTDTLSRLGLTRIYLWMPDVAADVDRHFEHYLDLDTCQLGDLMVHGMNFDSVQFWHRTVKALANRRSLKVLHLGVGFGLGYTGGPTSRGIARAVSCLLKSNPCLEEVALLNSRMDKRPSKNMARGLRQNKTLKILKISECGMRESIFSGILLPALAAHPTLERFELTANSPAINADRIVDLITCLPKGSSLKYLAFSGDGHDKSMTLEQATALLKALKNNFSLQILDIPDMRDPALEKQILTILRLNAAGRSYLANGGENNLAAGVSVLSAVSNDLDCLFYHLRENPLICKIDHQ